MGICWIYEVQQEAAGFFSAWSAEKGFHVRYSPAHEFGTVVRKLTSSEHLMFSCQLHIKLSLSLPNLLCLGFQLKSNCGQVTYLYQKQVTEKKETQEFQTFQEFLDKSQYSVNGILRYEKIFGSGW